MVKQGRKGWRGKERVARKGWCSSKGGKDGEAREERMVKQGRKGWRGKEENDGKKRTARQ